MENICGVVFEEVTVKTTGVTVNGPVGPVAGAITVNELHKDGSREDKTFAPGYGEFFTGSGADSEALALAVITDATTAAMPAALTVLHDSGLRIESAAASNGWTSAASTLTTMNAAWNGYRTGTPPLLAAAMTSALTTLGNAVTARSVHAARIAAIEATRAALGFQLRHRPPTAIDRQRFDLWALEVLADAAVGNSNFVRGDVTSLEWTRHRFAHVLSATSRSAIDAILVELRTAADSRSLRAATSAATRLRAALAAAS
jgi:hypothetical protein